MNRTIASLSFAAVLVVLNVQGVSAQSMSAINPNQTIAEYVVGSPDHMTLAKAIEAAGLVETLKDKGPFTLFAPIDTAFAAFHAGMVDAMLQPEEKEALATLLKCHVIGEAFVSTDIAGMSSAGTLPAEGIVIDTLGGCKITVNLTADGTVTLTDENGTVGRVVAADLAQANGVVHAIDVVILPKGMESEQ